MGQNIVPTGGGGGSLPRYSRARFARNDSVGASVVQREQLRLSVMKALDASRKSNRCTRIIVVSVTDQGPVVAIPGETGENDCGLQLQLKTGGDPLPEVGVLTGSAHAPSHIVHIEKA